MRMKEHDVLVQAVGAGSTTSGTSGGLGGAQPAFGRSAHCSGGLLLAAAPRVGVIVCMYSSMKYYACIGDAHDGCTAVAAPSGCRGG